jgi:DNA-binding response OmpR family regulator
MDDLPVDNTTILVIDDMPAILKVLRRQLEHWGYRALTAESGEEGLALAEAHQPDLILLDILMPKMKGREVCTQLKASEKTKDVPIIFLSALGLSDHVRAGLDIGAEDYVIKPFKPDYLRERIKICLLRNLRQKTKRSAP